MLNPPIMHTIPLIKTPLSPTSSPKVTRKGAAMFPRFDIASEIPVPVDLISVGNDYVVIKENKAKPNVFMSRLKATKTI